MSVPDRDAANERLNLLLSLRRYADAERFAREAIGWDPEWGAGYTHLARALNVLGRCSEAEAAARVGVTKAPADGWPLAILAWVRGAAGDVEGGLAAIRESLRLDPSSAWAYVVLADLLERKGQHLDALRATEDGLRRDPTDEVLLNRKAWVEYQLGRSEAALGTTAAGLRFHPNSAMLTNLVGVVALFRARETWWPPARVRWHRDAHRAFAEAIRLDPADPAYRRNLRLNATAAGVWAGLHLVLFGHLLAVGTVNVLDYFVYPGGRGPGCCCGVIVMPCLVILSLGILSRSEACQLATPVGWFGLSALPRSRRERRRGRRHWVIIVAMMVLPLLAAGLLAL
ncbi:MAG: hypothetical protein K2X82_26405 [Gemmataceae bacterium]|nr:hypothetical protein [Gemmataceae bacterium]